MTLLARGVALQYSLAAFTLVLETSSGKLAECLAGSRVFGISVWHGVWLDGLDVTCTGGDGQFQVPEDYYDFADSNLGGARTDEDVCANTAGVLSIEWDMGQWFAHTVVQNVIITCMDGAQYTFAENEADLAPANNETFSCDEDQYVVGINYDIVYVNQLSSSTTEIPFDDDVEVSPYVITNIGVTCSSRVLDPMCDADNCSGGTTLKDEQPEFCKLVVCSESECCDEVSDSEDQTDEIVTGIVSSVAAALLLAAGAWTCRKCSNARTNDKNEVVGPQRFAMSR